MIQPIFRKVIAIAIITCFAIVSQAQPVNTSVSVKEIEKTSKPYRILTSGKQVSIKSTKDINSIMVWTSGGNRILEQKNVNSNNYNFRVTIKEKIFFVMLRLANGETYSEKIGVQ